MPDRCIVIKFPSYEAIDKCFSSEEYRIIMGKRINNVDGRAIIVEGDDWYDNTPNKIGCTIYAGEKERKWIENIDIQYQERPIPNFYNLAGAPVKVDYCLKDKDKIELEDGCILHAIETPGHSMGEISYLVDNSLFIGDCIPVKGDIPIYVNKTEVIESLNKIKALKYAVDNFYPAWDITYSNENIDLVIENAFDIVNDIEYAVGIASQESNNIDTIVKKVCQMLNKPLLEKHPLFTKTICAHIQTD